MRAFTYLPLAACWPQHVQRTPASKRRSGPYRAGLSQTIRELGDLFDAWKIPGRVDVGTDLTIGPQGGVRSDASDPGIVVRFARQSATMVLALDRYLSPDDNLRGIFLCLQGMRRIERDGTSQLWEQMMHGFTAIPHRRFRHLDIAPGASREQIDAAFRAAAKELHPDHGGPKASSEAFRELCIERDIALSSAP